MYKLYLLIYPLQQQTAANHEIMKLLVLQFGTVAINLNLILFFSVPDFESNEVVLQTNARCSSFICKDRSVPLLKMHGRFDAVSKEMELEVFADSTLPVMKMTVEHHQKKIFPKIFQWASPNETENRKQNLSCIPNDSHGLISEERYLAMYSKCKNHFAQTLKKVGRTNFFRN